MDLKNISLNLYSFGYYGGFIKDNNRSQKPLGIDGLVKIVKKHDLGGIEIPLDHFYPVNEIKNGIRKIENILSEGISVFIDLEKTNVNYINQLLPYLPALDIKVVRIKMDQIGKTIYGGNRYHSDTFDSAVSEFKQQLISLLPVLKRYNVTLAIENHQDFHSSELVKLVEEISTDCLGITWDIGNSVSAIDSPESFYQTACHLIRNVHLKDYRIYNYEKGIRLVRCPIGEGYVDFQEVLRKLNSNEMVVNMSIELGAQKSRECEINIEKYWNEFSDALIDRKSYMEYIKKSRSFSSNVRSIYESGQNEQRMIESELSDIELSVSNIKQMLKDIS
jgi:3-oxoisoapionate decarboxylase